MTKLSEYLHTAQAAEYLDVHHNTIRNWAARGELSMHRNPVNVYRLFKRADLDMLLKKVAKPVKPTLRTSENTESTNGQKIKI